MSEAKPVAPKWAGRVAKLKIARVYKDDANGIHDEELLNDIAYTLWTRCKDMLIVEEARNGLATCPICEVIVEHQARKGTILDYQKCGWRGSWDDYRASFSGLHLIAPGLQPFCREYVKRLPLAKTPKEKMYWVDWLIHRCRQHTPNLKPAISFLEYNPFTNLNCGETHVPIRPDLEPHAHLTPAA